MPAARSSWPLRVERQKRLDAGEKPDFLPETAKIRESDWTVAPLPKDILDRRVEITGPVDRKMIINALNCGANVFMADFEDASTPTWANMIEGQYNLADAVRRADRLCRSGQRQVLQAERKDRGAVRASARLAPAREAHDGRRQADVGLAVRFRPVLLPQRQGSAVARHRPVLLPAEDGEPSRGAAVERRVRRRPGRARRAAEVDQGHGADRDHRRHLRDGRDPVGAEGPFGRPQLRPLGLHLLLHQEVPRAGVGGAAGSRHGRHDLALPALLQPARDQDLPPPRSARDGRHGGADSDQERSEGQRRGDGPRPCRQEARGRRRP